MPDPIYCSTPNNTSTHLPYSNLHKPAEHRRLHRYVIAALLTAMGIAGPMALKAIGMIAGMALVTSKVALTIAGIIALKKIYSSDHHHQQDETSFHVHASGDTNRRSSNIGTGGVGGGSNNNFDGSTYVVRPIKSTIVSSASGGEQMDPYRYFVDNPGTAMTQV